MAVKTQLLPSVHGRLYLWVLGQSGQSVAPSKALLPYNKQQKRHDVNTWWEAIKIATF